MKALEGAGGTAWEDVGPSDLRRITLDLRLFTSRGLPRGTLFHSDISSSDISHNLETQWQRNAPPGHDQTADTIGGADVEAIPLATHCPAASTPLATLLYLIISAGFLARNPMSQYP